MRLFLKLARAGLLPVEVLRSAHKILHRLLLPDSIVYRTSTPPDSNAAAKRRAVSASASAACYLPSPTQYYGTMRTESVPIMGVPPTV